MGEQLWARRPPPEPGDDHVALLHGVVSRAAELTATRGQLATALAAVPPSPPHGEEEVERLLLAFEELASNGLRHGGPPVQVTVTATHGGWLIVVTDGAVERGPTPARDRDPALGGLGLYLVARLCTEHGWWVDEECKHVWARVGSRTALP